MTKVEGFLSDFEEQEIVKAIQNAENNTSGEIRVHIENTSHKNPVDRALEVFYLLKMDATKQRNGILLYVAVESKQFAILGDEGIHKKVSDDFWNEEKELVLSHFAKKEYMKGLVRAIEQIGEKLKGYFPHQSNDINELPNEISKGNL